MSRHSPPNYKALRRGVKNNSSKFGAEHSRHPYHDTAFHNVACRHCNVALSKTYSPIQGIHHKISATGLCGSCSRRLRITCPRCFLQQHLLGTCKKCTCIHELSMEEWREMVLSGEFTPLKKKQRK